MKKLYMYTTKDDLELPLIVEEDPKVLAKKIGMSTNCLHSLISKKRRGYVKVDVDEEDDMRIK